MTKTRTIHRCAECGATSPQWSGRCPSCGEWNTLHEERAGQRAAAVSVRPPSAMPVPLVEVDAGAFAPRPTGLEEFDRVLSGGLVPGSVTLIGGEPGIGKSTLLLQLVASAAERGARCLLIAGEESAQQVRLRAARLGTLHPRVLVHAETALDAVLEAAAHAAPDVMVVDSIQTLFDPQLESAPGSVTQVRECAHQLVQLAKSRAIAVVLVGHVTKEGALAGPRVLEHVVDTVLAFEGERHHALRLLRAAKHRFGTTGELGLFEMTDEGLIGVPDPSALFLGDRSAENAGSVIVPTMEGQRPLLVEVQALVAPTNAPMPRRSVQGLDIARVSVLVAVLERRANVGLSHYDIYASAVGGVRITEPGCDLGVAFALASAVSGSVLSPGLVACGEVGLGGEIRQVAQMPRRLAEVARLGFTEAVVPSSSPDGPAVLKLHRVRTLADALDAGGIRMRRAA